MLHPDCTHPTRGRSLFPGNQDRHLFSHHDTCQEWPAPFELQIGAFLLLPLIAIIMNYSTASVPGLAQIGYSDWRLLCVQLSPSGFSSDQTVASRTKPESSIRLAAVSGAGDVSPVGPAGFWLLPSHMRWWRVDNLTGRCHTCPL